MQNTVAFDGVTADNPKAKEHADVACVNVTESVSVHRVTAVFDAMRFPKFEKHSASSKNLKNTWQLGDVRGGLSGLGGTPNTKDRKGDFHLLLNELKSHGTPNGNTGCSKSLDWEIQNRHVSVSVPKSHIKGNGRVS